jgi:cation transport regulator ChaC
MDDTFIYFAYGSNMLSRRLLERTPSAVFIGIGYLCGRKLVFDKDGYDGSGKCDMERTSSQSDRVYGVLYRIDSDEKPLLDQAEGLGESYRQERVRVITDGGEREAMAYVAIRKAPDLLPYNWYKSLVVAGAVEHGLPDDYVERLRNVDSMPDTDDQRRAKNEALITDE